MSVQTLSAAGFGVPLSLVVLVVVGILCRYRPCRPQGLEFHSLLLPAASEAGRQGIVMVGVVLLVVLVGILWNWFEPVVM